MESHLRLPRSSSSRINLQPATAAHVGRIARRLRSIDHAEVSALGHDPRQAVRIALIGSSWALTAMIDGSPHGMFGVTPVAPWKGEPWFLGTDEIYRNGRAMLIMGQAAVDEMQRHFPLLENIVSAENARAIRLLKRWGFTVEQGYEKIGGLAFRRFRRSR